MSAIADTPATAARHGRVRLKAREIIGFYSSCCMKERNAGDRP
jgi:hypothetical protein